VHRGKRGYEQKRGDQKGGRRFSYKKHKQTSQRVVEKTPCLQHEEKGFNPLTNPVEKGKHAVPPGKGGRAPVRVWRRKNGVPKGERRSRMRKYGITEIRYYL